MGNFGKIGIAAFALAGLLTVPAGALPKAQAIIPGKYIGHLFLGERDSDKLEARLETSLSSEAWAGRYWQTSYAKKTAARPDSVPAELDIHFHLDPNYEIIDEIRVTSSYFKTASGISTRNSFEQIKRAYPHIKRVKTYTTAKTNGPVQIYDDEKNGIAFEIYRGWDGQATVGLCTAITVHLKGESVVDMDTFPPLTTYLQRKDAGEVTVISHHAGGAVHR